MIFFLYLLVLSGFVFTRGFFSLNGIFIMIVSLLLSVLGTIKKNLLDTELISPYLLLLILCLLSLILYGGLYQQNIILVFLSLLLLSFNLFLALFLAAKNPKDYMKIFLAMLTVSFLLRLFMIWSSPNPLIDVYDYLKNGALGFLQGQNPYSMVYTKLYENVTADFYSYLPAMLFLTLPFVTVFNDPRYAVLAAELLIAFLIYKIADKKENGYLFSLLTLNNPISLYMIEQSYTEPIVVSLLMLFAYFVMKKRSISAGVSLGILLATKQYAVLVVPLALRMSVSARHCLLARSHLARLGASLIIAVVIILPFFLWNKADFIHDAVTLQLNFPPRYEGLSFFSLLYRIGISYNFGVSTVIIGALLIPVYLVRKISLSRFFFLSSLAYLVFFFFNKWAFINYYYLIAQLLLISGILRENKL